MKELFVSMGILILMALGLTFLHPLSGKEMTYFDQVDSFSKEDRAYWHQLLQWPDNYEVTFDKISHGDEAGLKFFRLTKQQYLVEVMTYTGAYQPGWIYLFYDEAKATPATLLSFQVRMDEDGPVYINELAGWPQFDKEEKTLFMFTKFRGLGDCGAAIHYQFNRIQTQVLEARIQECEVDPNQPEINWNKWPLQAW